MNKTLTHCGISSAQETASLLSRYGCAPKEKPRRAYRAAQSEHDFVKELLGMGKPFKEVAAITGKSFGFISTVKNGKW